MDDKPEDEELGPDEEILESAQTPDGGQLIKPGASGDKSQEPGSPAADEPPPAGKKPDKGSSRISRLTSAKNFYLIVFVTLLILAAGLVVAALRWPDDGSSDKVNKPRSLTPDQLAELAGSTTLVGDAKQILDIQSDTIFEGQVLARSDVDIAGSLKVGGALSLPSVNIGDGSFNTLAVAGNVTLQGQLTVQGNFTAGGSASFKTLSASQLNVSSLQLSGDLAINRHITPGGGVPTKSNGSALGSGGTASVSGSDTAGTVTINTGGGPPAGCFLSVNFVAKFNTTPRVVISPSNSSAGNLNYYTNRNTSGFSLCTTNVPSAGTNYIFDYIVFD